MSSIYDILDNLPANPNLLDLQDIGPIDYDSLSDEDKDRLYNIQTRVGSGPLFLVSAMAEALRGMGADKPLEDFVGTQEWYQTKMGADPYAPENIAGDLITPDPWDMAQLARHAPDLAMILWHGSHAKYDKVDPSKILTGEGAAAYSPGHYGAQRRGIGEDYKRQVTQFRSKPGGTYAGQSADDILNDLMQTGRYNNYQEANRWLSHRPPEPDTKFPPREELMKIHTSRLLDELAEDLTRDVRAFPAGSGLDQPGWSAEDWLNYKRQHAANRRQNIVDAWNQHMAKLEEFDEELVDAWEPETMHQLNLWTNTERRLAHELNLQDMRLETLESLDPQKLAINERGPGYLYEFHVPDEEWNKMLDWDSPLFEQKHIVEKLRDSPLTEIDPRLRTFDDIPPSIMTDDDLNEYLALYDEGSREAKQAFADRILNQHNRENFFDRIQDDTLTGEKWFNETAYGLMHRMGGPDMLERDKYGRLVNDITFEAEKELARLLREMDIPGTKFWDGVSRRPARAAARAQQGLIKPLVNAIRGKPEREFTRNTSIWNDDIITLLRRNDEDLLPPEEIERLRNGNR